MAELITLTLDRQAAAQVVSHLRTVLRNRPRFPSKRQFQSVIAALETALSHAPMCPTCHGTRFVSNGRWDGFYAGLADDEEPSEASRAGFAALYGPELVPCPECQPQPAERLVAA